MRRIAGAFVLWVFLGTSAHAGADVGDDTADQQAPPTSIGVEDGTLEVVARQAAATSTPVVHSGTALPPSSTGYRLIECWLFFGRDLAIDDEDFYQQYSVYDLLVPISVPADGGRYFRWCKVNGDWEPSTTLGPNPPFGTVSAWIIYTPGAPLGPGLVTAPNAVDVVLDAVLGDLAIDAIDTSPPATVDIPLGVDVWLWLPDGEFEDIGPLTAQAGAVWATAWATPREIAWDMGDGTVVICDGEANVEYDAEVSYDTQAELDHCGHVYDDPPDSDTYPVSATVTWGIDIATNVNPVRRPFIASTQTTSPIVDIPVVELQAVIK